jgi:glutathione S-transferase
LILNHLPLSARNLPFHHEHIFDASKAPRGQLPYIVDDGEHIGDSDSIIAYLVKKFQLSIDSALTAAEHITDLMIRRTLDDLYWVMSYSRWKDPQFWPQFRDELLKTHSGLTMSGLEAAQKYNFQRYHYQGIGRYEPSDVYKRGLADLRVLASVIGDNKFLFGSEPTSIDHPARFDSTSRPSATIPTAAKQHRYSLTSSARESKSSENLTASAFAVLRLSTNRGLTLRAAAREAGVSHAAPKNHFGDLIGLLSDLAAGGFARFRAAMEVQIRKSDPAPARLEAIGRGYVTFARTHPDLFLLMFRSERLDFTRPALRSSAASAADPRPRLPACRHGRLAPGARRCCPRDPYRCRLPPTFDDCGA